MMKQIGVYDGCAFGKPVVRDQKSALNAPDCCHGGGGTEIEALHQKQIDYDTKSKRENEKPFKMIYFDDMRNELLGTA